MTLLSHRPRLSGLAIWNMCVGFFGIQIGFGLQNANTSRIFQTLGAEVDTLAILWIAAPLTGLLVQPIIGHFSDRTWTRFGRRRPYFLIGAIATTLALIAMPNSPSLWFAAAMLWIMDASINITMEPFRAFVGDNLPEEQRTTGYAMQSFFIGAGGGLRLDSAVDSVQRLPRRRDGPGWCRAPVGQDRLLCRGGRSFLGRAVDRAVDQGIQPRTDRRLRTRPRPGRRR